MAIHDVSGNTPTVSIEVENIGHRTARLTGLYWATGFFGPRWLVPKWFRSRSAFQIIDYSWIINENFPWTLEPGEAKSTHFRREEFLKEFVKPEEEDFFRKLPWSSRYRLLRMRVGVGVYTREGIIFGRVDSKLICELENRYPLNN